MIKSGLHQNKLKGIEIFGATLSYFFFLWRISSAVVKDTKLFGENGKFGIFLKVGKTAL